MTFLSLIPWILSAILYAPVFFELYLRRWETIDYTHAYFILPVSLIIAWTKREKITKAVELGHSPLPLAITGISLAIFSLSLYILGGRWNYLFIQTLSLIPLLAGMVLFLYNKETLKNLAFPISYLLLLVPVPLGILDSITLPMRYAASTMSAYLLNAMHYDVAREGLLLNMGGHEIFMGAPCSGFRSLITMMSLGLVYIYFCGGTKFKNIILFVSIIPLALFGNLFRVITLCLITFYWGEKAGQGFFHNFSGIVVFLIIILGLIGLEKLVSEKGKR